MADSIAFFGVRRQSEAATALWIKLQGAARSIQSGVAASLCRRTPNLNKCEIELLLEDQRIAVDIQRAQIILDLIQHVALGSA
jgi:hypothetical protein